MVCFSNCKINIGLYIVQKRIDGFHNINTVFVPLPLYDVLEVLPSDNMDLTVYNQKIPGKKSENIVIKAYQLLQKKYHLAPVHIHLLKNIPIGAGLGAGSANGAYTLQLLNEYFSLQISKNELLEMALELGSDCPFFIENKPVYATQRGEIFTPIDLNLNPYKLVIINPGIHISTLWAFQQVQPTAPKFDLLEAIQHPMQDWKNLISNDFEPAVLSQYPAIQQIKETLYQQGAQYASLSGTGSTVYGFFNKKENPVFSFPQNYWVKEVTF